MFLTCAVIGQSGGVFLTCAVCDWTVWRCVFLTRAVIGQSGGVCFSPIL